MMIATFNAISDELKKRVEPLKPHQTAVYELLHLASVDCMDEQTMTRERMLAIPASVFIPNRDRIFDLDGQWKDIGFITGQIPADINGQPSLVPQFGSVKFEKVNKGLFVLRGNNPGHQDLYQYLEICNYNETSVNPNRQDPAGRTVMFKRIKPEEKAASTLSVKRLIAEAQRLIDAASRSELVELCNEFKQPTSSEGEEDIMRELLFGVADKQYDKILNRLSDASFQIKNLCIEAEKAKVLSWETEDNKWVWTDNRVTICSGNPGKTAMESLVLFAQVSADSQKVVDKIKVGLKASTVKRR